MADQVTLDWLFSPTPAPAWCAPESPATTIPCDTSDELITELRALRGDVASLVSGLEMIVDCWVRQLDATDRNAVPPEIWAMLDAIVRRRRRR